MLPHTDKEFILKPIRFFNPPKRADVSPTSMRRMLFLIANTVGFAVLYYLLPNLGFFYLPHIYLIGGGALAIWYVIYNRGFNTRGKTADMLPDELPLEQREKLIAEGKQRAQRSAWALLILLPIVFVFLLDTVYLFLIPEGLFS